MPEEAMSQISSLVENTSYLTWDLLAILAFLAIFLLYAYSIGKDSLIPSIIALYISGFTMMFLPYINNLESLIKTDSSISSIIIFAIVYLIVFFVLKWNGFFEPYVVPTGIEIALFAISFTGLLAVILGSLMSVEMIASFSPLSRMIFTGNIAVTIWSLAPLGLFILIRGDT
ncbi:hypothetical protein CO057_03780 [Candidatus Uhrbacteria bacterium CG_4_9_14_0_2_um_filter_41_50]|uniref:Uncharacterized protein n=1 Tax=Candidatus Uhrbacteria bacterium CG_4_9_14_0_2_um_filter_41_50 TaxID=1975031 RepID=A0A2M8END4_9BACT|nr:MAG: hypothetical protein COZ45_00155 [Candidatus Uhrbacteria bacterium CG_4_10_14_3_um_filter_41_21]PIZ55005.1 MAG: hypothetical protein COY24_01985 [Candidatus Uhrbacteria bacterium CG_4_10_14_0_2_um_filter_41_21]PJB84771.1 MAG: hypothetical protein CO086_01840 [Candidatus Uhrbacteria bacterium CG_4_9_14_0_8_um_filter_41_16]PJC24256.1 MAG: hypothetical protein CO057_03780 [Candidatus Uhrbacteria bacterium CG_4_9_14_0_2_um_filter_41_50]PJE74929.1 MAG: hypothetical protein COV03_02840 [Candi